MDDISSILLILSFLFSIALFLTFVRIVLEVFFPFGIDFEFKKKPKKEKYIEPWDIPDKKL